MGSPPIYSSRVLSEANIKSGLHCERDIRGQCLWLLLNKYVYISDNKDLCKKNQLHAISRTHQGRQRETSVNTPFPFFPPIQETFHLEWRNSTPRFASTPERRNKNVNSYIFCNYFASYPRTFLRPTISWLNHKCGVYSCEFSVVLNGPALLAVETGLERYRD